jgi:uncharacterized protein (DUF2336 family)
MPPHALSLTAELDTRLGRASSAECSDMLLQVAGLFLSGVNSYNDDHIAVFDEVMTRLVENAERQALVELGGKLARLDNAPPGVIRRLSRNDHIAVSGPFLEKCPLLSDDDLIELGKTKGPAHLLAIAARTTLSEAVTEVLVNRENSEVAHRLVANEGARFSEIGFVKLVNAAGRDKALAAAVARRPDLPPELLPFVQMALS